MAEGHEIPKRIELRLKLGDLGRVEGLADDHHELDEFTHGQVGMLCSGAREVSLNFASGIALYLLRQDYASENSLSGLQRKLVYERVSPAGSS